MELSIDTSTRFASVGLSQEGLTLSELTWRSERNHSVELVPAIRTLIKRVGVELKQLQAIIIAEGPGAFSALRVGMSTAKAMAVSLNIPTISINTLDIEYSPYSNLGYSVRAVIGAGRNRVYSGTFEKGKEPLYEVLNHEDFSAKVEEKYLYCGEGISSIVEILSSKLGNTERIVNIPPPTRRAGLLAHLGYQKLKAGDLANPMSLQPLYLRSSQVDTANRTWLNTSS